MTNQESAAPTALNTTVAHPGEAVKPAKEYGKRHVIRYMENGVHKELLPELHEPVAIFYYDSRYPIIAKLVEPRIWVHCDGSHHIVEDHVAIESWCYLPPREAQ